MKRFLVTGGAGFIGSNFIQLLLQQPDLQVLNLDKLTYAGNLDSLQSVADQPGYGFIQADICVAEQVEKIINEFQPDAIVELPILPISEVVTSYYLRMRVEDQPGVLADITRILADHQISIDAMIQREPEEGEEQADIIMLTHQTREKNIDDAIARIEKLPVVTGGVTRLRMEGLL